MDFGRKAEYELLRVVEAERFVRRVQSHTRVVGSTDGKQFRIQFAHTGQFEIRPHEAIRYLRSSILMSRLYIYESRSRPRFIPQARIANVSCQGHKLAFVNLTGKTSTLLETSSFGSPGALF